MQIIHDTSRHAPDAPYLIAEMACAHEGKESRARRLIDAAVAAGFDAIQLQIFRRAHQVTPNHRLFPLLGKLELNDEAWESIIAHARQYEIDVFVFAYDLPSLEFALRQGIDGIKLSSADLSNPEMLERAARSGLTVTLGTGASTLDEVSQALAMMPDAGPVVLMHGMQNFPTVLDDAHVSRIALLRHVFGLPVGYQDHTDAELPLSRVIDLLALGYGAGYLEKHITLDRSEKGTDYQAALEPAEMIAYVATMREAARAAGSYGLKPFSDSDIQYRIFQKKRIVASRRIPGGTRITRDHVAFLRCEQEAGFSPMQLDQVLGKAAAGDIEPYTLIDTAALADA
ncbi:MAG: N-acetylneuraminate synthase family protein [Rhodothermales bacterium]|nr:N-acetylneuraminate synthase family protein [Rhodothermales bacterium]